MVDVEGKHNTVVMKLRGDKASLIRGSGTRTVVLCGQGGVLRKCNQIESELTLDILYAKLSFAQWRDRSG